nr:putative reverse transcriptase domain-containing protein [Tanacetum cinerariifolium]
MLKVSPWKGVVRFGKRGKLNPRYVGPFKVLAKVGKVAYKLELPQELSIVHHTFHVSNLKKCYSDEPLVMPLEGVHIDDTLQFVEEPVEIMEREIKRLKRSRIPLVKVRWNSRRGPEFTWELSAGNQTDKNAGLQDTNGNAGTQDNVDAGKEVSDQHYIVLPLWSSIFSTYKSSDDKLVDDKPKDDTGSKTVKELVNKDDQARDELDRLMSQEEEASDAVDALR